MLPTSRYLKYNQPYDKAISTCGNYAIILPEITRDFQLGKVFCFCHCLWTSEISDCFGFFLNQTIIVVDVPERYQLANYLFTPDKDKSLIRLDVLKVEDREDWTKPEFKDNLFVKNSEVYRSEDY